MNYPILFKLLSTILAALAAAFLVSFGVGEWMESAGEARATRLPWLGSIAIVLLFTLAFWLLGRKATPKIFRKEALAVIGVGWLLASALGALPYFLILKDASYATCFFESASGLTTTGSSTFADPSRLPLSLLFWRCLSQWIGGLGVIVFFVAILSYLGAGAKILYANEASASSAKMESGRVQSGIFNIVCLYLALSAACALALRVAGLDWFDAVCTMLATVSTGGFSNYSDSIAHYNSIAVQWIVIVFMTVGGVSFLLLIKCLQGKYYEARRNTELKAYLGIIGGATAVLTLLLILSPQAEHWTLAFLEALFQTVSILTTTGFATVNYELWPPMGHVIIILLILVGGCSGSTSGGIKVVRAVVLFKGCLRQVEHAFRSRVVRPLHINGRVLRDEEQHDIRSFIILLFVVLCSGSLLLAALEPHISPQGVFSAVLSSLCNVGPGLNEVGPVHSFAKFSDAAKVLLGIVMIMGRLELYALLALFYPSLWKRFS